MQDNRGQSDASVHTDEDPRINQTPMESRTDYLGAQKQFVNSENTAKLMENFDYSTSEAIFSEQPPPYSQLSTSAFPFTYHYEKNQMTISTVIKPRDFFLISSIIYFIWGSIAFLITIVLAAISSVTPYFGIWSACLILNGLINIYVVLWWSSKDRSHLKRLFHFTLFLNTIGFVLSAVASHSRTSTLCLYSPDTSCDSVLRISLQSAFVLAFILTTIHNIFNIVMIRKIDNRIMLKSLPTAV